jgi:nucleoside-diphosphate-sugar epimerase
MSLDKESTVLVAGAGGFIGGHIVKELIELGFQSVRGVDIKPLDDWYQIHPGEITIQADLRDIERAFEVTSDTRYVINLAADMGGMGFIENNKALCMLSVLVNTHLLQASAANNVERFFFSSSACVYAADHQTAVDAVALKESDAYPAMPEDGYGWEKLFSERMCRHFSEDFALSTRVARYHNIYGPEGTWTGGREKAPAAICRKVAEAVLGERQKIDIWGDGHQTRSFTYISDCVKGTLMLLASDFSDPINIGSSEMVSIDQLVDIVEEIAGVSLERQYDLDAPKGVRGRNSDNTLIESVFNWQPSTVLKDGLELTYRWVYDQVARSHVG